MMLTGSPNDLMAPVPLLSLIVAMEISNSFRISVTKLSCTSTWSPISVTDGLNTIVLSSSVMSLDPVNNNIYIRLQLYQK